PFVFYMHISLTSPFLFFFFTSPPPSQFSTLSLHDALPILFQRLIGHDRPEVGAADPDVNDVANALAGMPFPRSAPDAVAEIGHLDRKSTRLNSSHVSISYAVFC